MPLLGPPNVSKLAAKGDLKGLIKALGYQKDSGVRRAAAEALGRLGWQPNGTEAGAASRAAAGAPTVEPAAADFPRASASPMSNATPSTVAPPLTAASPSNSAPRPASDSRVVRVFVSSTFRDMGAERDELVKRTFPALRKLCESRDVTFGEVDLRWGVTDEQKAEGQVLPICLAEIRGCRPYFLGLLGERYGWVPDALDPALIEQEPWLAEQAGRSVTELEILHGVLNDPAMAEHAFFYLRDPAYVEGRQADLFREIPTPDEIASIGLQEAEREAAARRARLAELKERLRSSDFPVHEDYPDPRVLGALVLADLAAVIDRLFPVGSETDPLEREAAEHEAFARSRSRVYIGRPDDFDRLDAHAAGDGPPLILVGESGSGKSALLANWALRYRASHPDDLILLHFIGASPASTDWAAMARRAIGGLSRRFSFAIEIPDRPDALRGAFTNALHMAAANGRVVLVIDALDQLEDGEGALDLAWLPPVVPANIRLVLSTLPGRSLAEIERRAYPTLAVAPLNSAERERLIVDYLASYTKALDPALRRHLASGPQCANPLYLRALLDELRLWGEHETLRERIDHYLAAPTIDCLYEMILARYETDYERDRPGLLRDAFSLLWAARRGLSETELLDLLGTDGSPLPRAHWSPLFLAAESSLTSRSGSIGFFHDYLRAAVEHRYLDDAGARQTAHLRVADYFAAREITARKVDELPWQLARAQAWQRLADVLADLDFLQSAWNADQFDVKAAWAQVEANSSLRIVDAYRSAVDDSETHAADQLRPVATLLVDTGHPEPALSIQERLAQSYRETGDRANLTAALNSQALILGDRGELEQAMGLHVEVERICRELGDRDGLQASLGNQAGILGRLGRLDEATALLAEVELIYRELDNRAGLQASLGNQAGILHLRGELGRAMTLYKEQERICRELGKKDGLGNSLGGQADVLQDRGDLDGAMALYKEQELICRELGAPDGLQRSLGGQAVIRSTRGDLDGAMALYKEQEGICRELGAPASLATSLGCQANVLQDRGDLDGAMALYKEQELICRELKDPAGLQSCFGNQALVLRDRGDLDGAMALHKEEELICRELEDSAGLQRSFGNQALILQARGDLDGAMALLKEKERICRELGNPMSLQAVLGNQGVILQARGDLDGAMATYKEVERICRELENPDGLQASLGNQGVILYAFGDLDGAMALHREQERICREIGKPADLQRSLGNQALVLRDRGDLDGAMALHKEEELICRELENPAGLQRSFGNQALILQALGDLDGAMALLKEQERICRELDNKEGLQISLANQADNYYARGDLDGAMVLLKEQECICRELGDPDGLQRSLGIQAVILGTRGDFDGAMVLLKEQECICREVGNRAGLVTSLTNQVHILHPRGDLDGAMILLKEQERICRELADPDGLQHSLSVQAVICGTRGDLDGAMALLKEQERICRELDNKGGLQISLGNQAHILNMRGDGDGARALLMEQARIRSQLGNPSGPRRSP